MATHDRDTDDLPVWDTPLHDAIELVSVTVDDETSVVIYHPDRNLDEWLQSSVAVDTYDVR